MFIWKTRVDLNLRSNLGFIFFKIWIMVKMKLGTISLAKKPMKRYFNKSLEVRARVVFVVLICLKWTDSSPSKMYVVLYKHSQQYERVM